MSRFQPGVPAVSCEAHAASRMRSRPRTFDQVGIAWQHGRFGDTGAATGIRTEPVADDSGPCVTDSGISFTVRVQRVVRRIPPGRVIAYGGVAALIGVPRAARRVGQVMSNLPDGTDVPWWRVVNASGGISLRGDRGLLQRRMLEAEGVCFGPGDRIDWESHGWRVVP